MFLETIWLILIALHFGIPLAYYVLMRRAEKRTWNLTVDPNYKPSVTIILPMHNEENLVRDKLENLICTDYPMNKLDVIVVDSSVDNTAKIVKSWAYDHPEVKLNLIREEKRCGKGKALNKALPYASGEIVVISDADSLWQPQALKEAIKYLSDQEVAVVSALKMPISTLNTSALKTEKTYRNYYNTIRIGESKLHSSVIVHGELAGYRRNLLDKFEDLIGADDAGTAMNLVRKGYRAIMLPESNVCEHSPHTWRGSFKQKIRRAQHVMQLLKSNLDLIRLLKGPMRFIIAAEAYLHLVNPLLLVLLTILTITMLVKYWIFLVPAIILPLLAPRIKNLVRTWFSENLYLLVAFVKEAIGKRELMWEKVEEIRS